MINLNLTGLNVQLSGAISNDPDYYIKFDNAEKLCYELGAKHVWNPAKEVKQDISYNEALLQCLIEIPNRDVLAMLPSWQNSKGAKSEFYTADACSKKIVRLYKESERFFFE